MISARFHPYLVGGAEKQALELSRALSSKGVRVLVITRRWEASQGDSPSGVPVLRLPAWGPGPVGSAVFVAAAFFALLLRARDYDAIHVHLAGSPALAACLAGRLLKKTVVVKLGGGRGIGEIAESRKTPWGKLKLLLLRHLKPRFTAVSQDLLDEAREAGLEGVEYVPNGVDLKRYSPAPPEEKARLRAALGWPAGLVILYAGRLAPEKRLGLALKAFAEARPSEGDLLVLAGEGGEAGALAAEASRLGVADKVRFLAPVDDIARFYRAADAFVLPSVSEGLSNALLEAMACGLAIVASAVGGTPRAVGAAGLLFKVEDPGGPRSAFERLLREPGLAGRLGALARGAAESYSLEKTVERYLALYGGERR